MALLFLLVILTACAAIPQDLSGKMFTFPLETNTASVRLTTSRQTFSALTVCLRSFTDLRRSHSIFSLATQSVDNDFLIYWDNAGNDIDYHVRNKYTNFGVEYKLNMWQSICSTWDSESGVGQLWIDGKPSSRKFISSETISGPIIIVLGQEQDSFGGGFDLQQSFVGMMSDVHMWDQVLTPCEIQNYMDELNFTPGNVVNWKMQDFQITGKVLIEEKQKNCL
ncbi:serum amyloid P-component-like [Toxotes jaculatrix]|uniref:serum amyloid P-component-like n=1 Tax=Toxotes jaculatrix TaxID=941984 RepID=UPI001B3AB184|nr:serum amyloid P-component-like [Toxotes jaculatrix]XP_040901392.1 serum amyloid P-component-like [Toxotes jaculatrix]